MAMKHVSVGPFGVQRGEPWDDGIFTGVKQLIIYSGPVIHSIQIEYDQNGQSKLSQVHGGEGGLKNTVKLNYPSEYIVSIWGYYSTDSVLACIQSLAIESNKRTYGAFGTERGKYFKFPFTSGKILGFYGKSGNFLNSFGAYSEPISDPSQSITSGPFGGQRGDPWDDGKYSTVRSVVISYRSVIESIQIEYDDNGKSKWSVKHGRSEGGSRRAVIQLNYPDEYLISISGHLNEDSSRAVIQSLSVQSNKKHHGPYGEEKGKHFSTQSIDGKIVGFLGRSGPYLVSIGAYFEPFLDAPPPLILGPFGGYTGPQWDDGIYSTVRQFIISAGVVIDSIQIEYDKNGQAILSEKHGQSIAGSEKTIKFEYPDEFLVSISGHYSLESAIVGLQSLTIHSNKRTYGPFGTPVGSPFTLPAPYSGSKIIGLHGRSGSYLDAIGAYFMSTLSPMHHYFISVGPFGGHGGDEWDDGNYTAVRQLIICSDKVINSIQVEYDQNGQSTWSEKRGGEGGVKNLVKLDYPSEYLVSIWGYYSSDSAFACVQSLTIESNKKIYGPFGTEKGKYFKFPLTSGKIVGFYGTCGTYLHSFGGYWEPIQDPNQFISVGPFGGQGGDQWDDGKYTTVRQFIISYGSVIDSIQFEYVDKGMSKLQVKHGRSEGGTKKTVLLDFPDEYLVSISGYLSEDSNKAIIQSLTIISNKRKYGPYGVEKGKQFSTSSNNGKIVGFYGRSGLYLDSIGAYFDPFPDTEQPVIDGPYGGSIENLWDDGFYTAVKQFIIYAEELVNSIQIEYEKNGKSVWSRKHGESTGGTQHMIKFDYPDEFLVSISGHYSLESAFRALQSLTIQSNRRTYGPFGTEIGNPFTFQPPHTSSKIIGLHGRSGSYLEAIGAYFMSKPILFPIHRFITVGPFGGHGGAEWDDGKYSGVKQLIVYSGSIIDSIQIEYDNNGTSKWGEKHSQSQGGNKYTVKLGYPEEYLVSIRGSYSEVYKNNVVFSLTFESNKTTYGPFGVEKGTNFLSPQINGKIVGFHGRSGDWLDSIGVHFESFDNQLSID